MVQGLPAHAEIVGAVNEAIDENARVRDGASEDVRRTRGRCRTLEGRLRSLLKGFQGEVSEQVPCHQPRPCMRQKFAIGVIDELLVSRCPVIGPDNACARSSQ